MGSSRTRLNRSKLAQPIRSFSVRYSGGGTALADTLLPPPRLPRAPLPGGPLAGGGVGTMPPAAAAPPPPPPSPVPGARDRRDGEPAAARDGDPADGGLGRPVDGGAGDTLASRGGGRAAAAGEVGSLELLRCGDVGVLAARTFFPNTSPDSVCGTIESLCAVAFALASASHSSANSSNLGCVVDLPLNETYLRNARQTITITTTTTTNTERKFVSECIAHFMKKPEKRHAPSGVGRAPRASSATMGHARCTQESIGLNAVNNVLIHYVLPPVVKDSVWQWFRGVLFHYSLCTVCKRRVRVSCHRCKPSFHKPAHSSEVRYVSVLSVYLNASFTQWECGFTSSQLQKVQRKEKPGRA